MYKSKIRRGNRWATVNKAREGERSEELRWEGKTLGEAKTGWGQQSSYDHQKITLIPQDTLLIDGACHSKQDAIPNFLGFL